MTIDDIFVLFLSVLVALIIASLVPISQINSIPSINEENFKIKQIKRLSFLFRGLYGCDVKIFGVIYPMYIFHIVGYVMAVVSSAAILVMYFACNVDVYTTGISGFIIIMGSFNIYCVGLFICWLVSKKRDKKKKSKENIGCDDV